MLLPVLAPTPTTPRLGKKERSLRPRPLPTQSHSHKISTVRAFTQADVAAFTSLTGDANPIHAGSSSSSPSSSTGTPTPAVVPGLLTAALFPALVGSAWPGAVYARQTLRFVGVVGVGDSVRVVVRVDRVRRQAAGASGRAVVTFTTTATRVGGGGGVVVEGEAVAVVPVELLK